MSMEVTSREAILSPAIPSSAWHASLQLGFSRDGLVTRLTERKHSGPLRVQKPLYPEGESICHAIVIHPPGGVVGGDQLHISSNLAAGAHALITTPGAAKWYRSNGHTTAQDIKLVVGEGAKLEWLPQESIFFDDACVDLRLNIDLSRDARLIASDVYCFGRTASGEVYGSGRIRQSCSIYREGSMIWHEQGSLAGGSHAMQNPLGLDGKSALATVVACGALLNSEQLQLLREQSSALLAECEPGALCGVTQMKAVIVARYLGNSSEVARHWQQLIWRHLRPVIMGCEAVIPRIWNT